MVQSENHELDLIELLQILWKRAWLIALLVFIAVTASGIMSTYFLVPQYQSSAEILVNQGKSEGLYNESDIRTNIGLMDTFKVIIVGPRILDRVIKDYNLD